MEPPGEMERALARDPATDMMSLGLRIEFLVLRPPVRVLGCLTGLTLRRLKYEASIPRMPTAVVTDIKMTYKENRVVAREIDL